VPPLPQPILGSHVGGGSTQVVPAARPTRVRFDLPLISSATFASVTPPAIEITVFGQALLIAVWISA
jgi:hypothetical protein